MPQFLSEFLNIELDDASRSVSSIISRFENVSYHKIRSQRTSINNEIYGGDGRSTDIENVIREKNSQELKTISGKKLFCELKNCYGQENLTLEKIINFEPSEEIAPSLKELITGIINTPTSTA